MQLFSDAFEHGDTLPRRFTCNGDDISPPLRWTGAPTNTRSFAVVCEDPDAPGGLFRHWGIFDIPANKHRLSEGLAHEHPGVDCEQVFNDFGNAGYGGACPPKGDAPHQYRFRVYALDRDHLTLDGEATVADLVEAAEGAMLDEAELVGRYAR